MSYFKIHIYYVFFLMIKEIINNFIPLLAVSNLVLQEYNYALPNWEPKVQSQKQELWELF